MKKLLLIIILLLTFTLIGDCWVAGYDQRIKLTTDHTKIDATLTNFPVTAFFTAAQAEEIFAEFDADEDFDRGQFALGDDTLLKAEKELFDDSASLAIYHFKATELSDSAGTDIYFYYDNDADHNTSYIGIIGSATAAEVWVDYAAVYHMVDATTSTVEDSTSNNHDGAKYSANNPPEVNGKVGKAQDFDGSAYDLISIPNHADFNFGIGEFTVEAVIKPDGVLTGVKGIVCKYPVGGSVVPTYDLWTNVEKIRFRIRDTGSDQVFVESGIAVGTWYYLAGRRTSANVIYLQKNASSYTDTGTNIGDIDNDSPLNIGRFFTYVSFDGIIDEVRISNGSRSNAWIEATYNSLWDTLLTYGSEEEAPPAVNVIFFSTPY